VLDDQSASFLADGFLERAVFSRPPYSLSFLFSVDFTLEGLTPVGLIGMIFGEEKQIWIHLGYGA
jgi:hypothetical protein